MTKDIGKQIVHADGRVWSKYSKDWIKPQPQKKGYLKLKVNGKVTTLHRVIAEAFVPNPDNLPEVDHISGIKSDNRAQNLRWVTGEENIKSYRNRLNNIEQSQPSTK